MKHFFPIFITALLTYSNTTNAITASSPQNISGVKTVSTQEAKELYDDGVLFVDVRLDSDWEKGRVPEALHLNITSGKRFLRMTWCRVIFISFQGAFYCAKWL